MTFDQMHDTFPLMTALVTPVWMTGVPEDECGAVHADIASNMLYAGEELLAEAEAECQALTGAQLVELQRCELYTVLAFAPKASTALNAIFGE